MEAEKSVAPGAFAMPGEDGFEYDDGRVERSGEKMMKQCDQGNDSNSSDSGRPEEYDEEDDENSHGRSENEEESDGDNDVNNSLGGESDSESSRKSMPPLPPRTDRQPS